MSHRILITGVSGYLGGTILNHLKDIELPAHDKIYALVRHESQAAAVRAYGVESITFDTADAQAVRDTILNHSINIVYFLIEAFNATSQVHFIKALAELKRQTGQEVHFLHTSGAKAFSSICNAPTERRFYDTEAEIYDIQKTQKAKVSRMQGAVNANNTVIELSESLGIRSYIVAPCIVYGRGEGFGNLLSIQTVAIAKAAKGAKRVYKVDADKPAWPVCHITDTASMFICLLRSILVGDSPGHGRKGYYLPSSGDVLWEDIYAGMATALFRRGIIQDESVELADAYALEAMAGGLDCDVEMVAPQLGGKCTFTARHGDALGWKPQYPAEHILESLDVEVELILSKLGW